LRRLSVDLFVVALQDDQHAASSRNFVICMMRKRRSSISRPPQEFKNARTSRVKRSGSSTLERCAALSST
jgi:hypothetical protein